MFENARKIVNLFFLLPLRTVELCIVKPKALNFLYLAWI